jgi:hypothetical protein
MDEESMEQFLSNYDDEFIYFFNSRLIKYSMDELKEVYLRTHIHEIYKLEDDRCGILYDLMDYLEVVSLLLVKIFKMEKKESNHISVFLFGISLSDIVNILMMKYSDPKMILEFVNKLKEYVKPSGIKSSIAFT